MLCYDQEMCTKKYLSQMMLLEMKHNTQTFYIFNTFSLKLLRITYTMMLLGDNHMTDSDCLNHGEITAFLKLRFRVIRYIMLIRHDVMRPKLRSPIPTVLDFPQNY